MYTHKRFQERVRGLLTDIDPSVLAYDESEFWMVESLFDYIEFYAIQNELENTFIALHLARGLHDGVHRKFSIIKDGVSYRLPYLIHPLSVTQMLVDLHIPFEHDTLDTLLAASLCHDMLEDVPFEEGGIELYTKYHLNQEVYQTVKYVTKRKDFTLEEEKAHFKAIQEHELALLIKLSDRGNNVEDLYNRSNWKVHEYVGETNRYILPMCEYALENYPERIRAFELLTNKIFSLTSIALILVDRFSEEEEKLQRQIDALRAENEQLRKEWKALWKM